MARAVLDAVGEHLLLGDLGVPVDRPRARGGVPRERVGDVAEPGRALGGPQAPCADTVGAEAVAAGDVDEGLEAAASGTELTRRMLTALGSAGAGHG